MEKAEIATVAFSMYPAKSTRIELYHNSKLLLPKKKKGEKLAGL